MALNLCIFGTPHGYDSYEVAANMSEYYEQFYRTNRRGRMLMANRRKDGSTVYSYLVYDLVETDLRPHAFFGTSFTLGGNQYIQDLRSLYMLFDNVFETLLVNSGLVFTSTAGKLKYKVGKFSSATDLLNDYLSKLTAGLSNFETEYYNDEFAPNNSGQIALCNIDTPESKLTASFKKVQWLAVSPYFKPEDPRIELDLGDLRAQYTGALERFAVLATSRDDSDMVELDHIVSDANTAITLLTKYGSQGGLEQDEVKQIRELTAKFDNIINNVNTLFSKRVAEAKHEAEIRKQSSKQKSTPDSLKSPRPISQKDNNHGVKDTAKSEDDSTDHKECSKAALNITDRIDPKVAGIIGIIATIVIVSCVLIFSDDKTPPSKQHDEVRTEAEIEDTAKLFDDAISGMCYDIALEYIENDSNRKAILANSFYAGGLKELSLNPSTAVQTLQGYLDIYPQCAASFQDETFSLKLIAKEAEAINIDLKASSLSNREKRELKSRIKNLNLPSEVEYNLLTKLENIPEPSTPDQVARESKPAIAADTAPLEIIIYETEGTYDITTAKSKIVVTKPKTKLKKGAYYVIRSNQPITFDSDPTLALGVRGDNSWTLSSPRAAILPISQNGKIITRININ